MLNKDHFPFTIKIINSEAFVWITSFLESKDRQLRSIILYYYLAEVPSVYPSSGLLVANPSHTSSHVMWMNPSVTNFELRLRSCIIVEMWYPHISLKNVAVVAVQHDGPCKHGGAHHQLLLLELALELVQKHGDRLRNVHGGSGRAGWGGLEIRSQHTARRKVAFRGRI